MSNDHPTLEMIPGNLNKLSDLSPEIMYTIAERLEEAISAPTRGPIKALATELIGLFNKLLRAAPDKVVHAVLGSASADASEHAAYLLGQVSLAQLLAAQASEHRVDNEFFCAIRDHRYAKYVKTLSQKDHTGTELAASSGECEETVSRKLKRLRELGITDFRREGTRLLNFLTPAARAVMRESEKPLLKDRSLERNRYIDLTRQKLPAHMQNPPTLVAGPVQKATTPHCVY